ncbi:MAG: tRNA preQ1(34) S-adenosylmethionine ribosyltransferase-isomerase QueA [Candidatus Magasanikbacteria bacterium]|nr:tRNA preQ1(34) S-adenosylmethionine ribosyltransferase-isomerase QueA [Candidatus Magasanikbacteria bacterium]
MLTSEFDYNLPKDLIAQSPIRPRDRSKLMVVDRKDNTIEHCHFCDITKYLNKGDLIVWNNSKVFKARLYGRLVSSTGRNLIKHGRDIEIFLVRPTENVGVWQVLARPGRHVRAGAKVSFAKDFYCDVLVKKRDGTILVQFEDEERMVRNKANKYGHIPVPPYVKDEPHELDIYQTVYAKNEGSVAAPTAGFHFTDSLIKKLKDMRVDFTDLTLHVGLGTFLPVKSERIEDHTMHSEWVEISQDSAKKINLAKKEGRRVIAVGTTTVRTLEGVSKILRKNKVDAYKGEIDIFIKPGFEFKVVDAMITNFHLPKSTLLMLVAAFSGDREFILDCYKKAVENKYRFYSFGDAMYIT